MSSQLSGPAYLDGPHHPEMPDGHAVAASRSVPVTEGSKDMGYFERSSHGERVFLGRLPVRFHETVQGTHDPADILATQMQIDRSGLKSTVAQQMLDMAKICACLQKIGGEGVT